MSLLKIEKASFQYGKTTIFQNINFELDRGNMFCLFGPNGCGKSTLIECILGYLKLSQGRILLNNQSIHTYRPAERAQQIGYVPQGHTKNFPYTVKDIVLMGRAAYTGTFSAPSKEDMEIAESAIETLGLASIRDKPYTQLSGGQTQLVMLARALAQETSIILMDEPTAHLDFRHELIILETIVKLMKEKNISVVMATHFPNHAFYFENSGIPTTVALMNHQAFEYVGSPAEVLTEANMLHTFKIHAKLMTAKTPDEKLVRGLIPIEVSTN